MDPSLPSIIEKGITTLHGESHAGFFLLDLMCAEQKEDSWESHRGASKDKQEGSCNKACTVSPLEGRECWSDDDRADMKRRR